VIISSLAAAAKCGKTVFFTNCFNGWPNAAIAAVSAGKSPAPRAAESAVFCATGALGGTTLERGE